MNRGKTEKAVASPLKLLLWVAVLGVIFGALGVGQPLDDSLRIGRNRLHIQPASGDIVLVAVDDESLEKIGRWPWSRSVEADLTNQLTKAGAKRVFFDVLFDTATNRQADEKFAAAIRANGNVVLPIRARSFGANGEAPTSKPLPMFGRYAQVGSISVKYDYRNAAWKVPYSDTVSGKIVPSFASMLGSTNGASGTTFPVDYSIDPASIPRISAAALLKGDVPPSQIAGKDVIVGTTTDALNDIFFMPGWGRQGGVYVHIIGAETLKRGAPVDGGWALAFVFGMILVTAAILQRRPWIQVTVLGVGLSALLVIPGLLERDLIFVDVAPALFALASTASVLVWRRFRSRGLVNAVTGLPNLAALRSDSAGRKRALIAARVLNYAEIAASMPAHTEQQLVDQIVARLTIGAGDRRLYQGDGGTFAWFEDPNVSFSNHLDALHALFRKPARVAGQQLDLAISFGVEAGSSRSLPNRLASAIVAAEKAAHDGLKWKYHDPDTLQDASWKLSMMSQLDSAIDAGEVWVAFQPQIDLATRQIIGCEALARWTHPQKGPIAAMEFVTAAEQHDRIGKLTDFVLDQSLAAGAQLERKSPGFSMAVNLSAKLLTDQGLRLRIEAALARHRFPVGQLILELTETAELGSNGVALDMLESIRELGVTISIDDYGTGLSTLEYLKKVPATEIKIDQSFVMGLMESRSDRLMVESTIALAHSLGRRVVAEGVQQRDVLDALTAMNCDVAQGFIIARPMNLETLLKRISGRRRSSAA